MTGDVQGRAAGFDWGREEEGGRGVGEEGGRSRRVWGRTRIGVDVGGKKMPLGACNGALHRDFSSVASEVFSFSYLSSFSLFQLNGRGSGGCLSRWSLVVKHVARRCTQDRVRPGLLRQTCESQYDGEIMEQDAKVVQNAPKV